VINNEIIFIGNSVSFFCENDEKLLMQWLHEIKCVDKINYRDKQLGLFINIEKISNNDFDNLMGIFNRYLFDNEQIKIFLQKVTKDLSISVEEMI